MKRPSEHILSPAVARVLDLPGCIAAAGSYRETVEPSTKRLNSPTASTWRNPELWPNWSRLIKAVWKSCQVKAGSLKRPVVLRCFRRADNSSTRSSRRNSKGAGGRSRAIARRSMDCHSCAGDRPTESALCPAYRVGQVGGLFCGDGITSRMQSGSYSNHLALTGVDAKSD